MFRRTKKAQFHRSHSKSASYSSGPNLLTCLLEREQRHAYGYTGWSMDTANDNFSPSYRESTFAANPTFMEAFGVFFTAVTGKTITMLK